jgi:hypothetical protein
MVRQPRQRMPRPRFSFGRRPAGQGEGIPIAAGVSRTRPAPQTSPSHPTAQACAAGAPVAARSGVPSRLTEARCQTPVSGANDCADVSLQHYENALDDGASQLVAVWGRHH